MNIEKEIKNVLVIYKYIPQYRIDFFELLRVKLLESGIKLHVIYGTMDNKGHNDGRTIDWGTFKKNHFVNIGSKKLIWQNCAKEIKGMDLVIVDQLSKLVFNYYLIILKLFGRIKFAYWGHSHNLQEDNNSLINMIKRHYINFTDYWFAYTNAEKSYLIKNRFPEKKISVVYNTIDSKSMRNEFDRITDTEINNLKKKLGIKNEIVFIYCGALYKEKRINFLIEACSEIHKKFSNVKLIIIGSGQDDEIIKQSLDENPWIIWHGPKFGREKALFFKVSDLFLIPGAIGLAVIDSFVFQTPIVTTNYEFHGPEFEYLENGINSIISENNIEAYTDAVLALIISKSSDFQKLKDNCNFAYEKYSLDNMVKNFAEGIINAINL